MASPSAVPSTIKALSSTTFVAEVNAPVLAVMVPLLIRALKERSTDTTRMTCIVIANLVKLVRDPKIAATYLGVLVPGVDNIAEGAAFPEIRAFAKTAQETLKAAGASADSKPPPARDIPAATLAALAIILPNLAITNLPKPPIQALPLVKSMPNEPIAATILEYAAGIAADMSEERLFDSDVWENRSLGPYLRWVLPDGKAAVKDVSAATLASFIEDDKVRLAVLCLPL
jgi:elongation factor 3